MKQEKPFYPNLAAEMARIGIRKEDLAEFLKKGNDTIESWLNGKDCGFPVRTAISIRDHYFPDQTLDALFFHDGNGYLNAA